jgi:23S rRNA (guanine2445-N2)-methyltransferase / 23S rRNA (guanine2069-N7)-methyltransferase
VAALDFFATCARATDDLVAAEMTSAGATDVRPEYGGVSFRGGLEVGYRACLWSRVASRVLLQLGRFPAADATELYAGVLALDWSAHLGPEQTLAVDFTSSRSALTHTHFGAQKVKDAIVDQLRQPSGQRPSVAKDRPDVRVNVHLDRNEAHASIDLSGESLHRRAYRDQSVPAPLKENLAAAILLRSRWPEALKNGASLVDPMCGSGTLLIEAALMARDAAPGLARDYWGFLGWRGHDADLWRRLLDDARERQHPASVMLWGFDTDQRAVYAAQLNAQHANVGDMIKVARGELAGAAPPEGATPGMVLINPPYGERLGNADELTPLYQDIGRVLKERFRGWSAHVLSGNRALTDAIGLRAARENTLWNGPIECRLVHYDLYAPRPARGDAASGSAEATSGRPPEHAAPAASREPSAFANRLAKNAKNLGKWAKSEGVTCYRVYDADIPEYAVAVDLYEGFAHVQEYAPPKTVDERAAHQRMKVIVAAVPEVLGLERDNVFVKVRQKQRSGSQYEKHANEKQLHEVRESGHTFLVNFTDYLDTGLFLDHRPTRRLIGELARGKRFLNLFAYTGTATVYAAKGGARSTTSVDLSHTYLDWARENLERNGIAGSAHELVRADVRDWLAETRDLYEVIFLDPPTFSTSKAMTGTLDLQRDHVELLQAVAPHLAKDGVLVFSTNNRRFKLDAEALPNLHIEDITARTIAKDFERNQRIHKAFLVTHLPG